MVRSPTLGIDHLSVLECFLGVALHWSLFFFFFRFFFPLYYTRLLLLVRPSPACLFASFSRLARFLTLGFERSLFFLLSLLLLKFPLFLISFVFFFSQLRSLFLAYLPAVCQCLQSRLW